MGTLAALRMPVDIFPSINIPIIGVAFQYQGLPPDQMAGRIITPFERALTTTVNDIEHFEANLQHLRDREDLLSPDGEIATANAQVTVISQSCLSRCRRYDPAVIINDSASTVPIIELGAVGRGIDRSRILADLGLNFAGRGWSRCRVRGSLSVRRQDAAGDVRPRHRSARVRGSTGLDVADALAAQNLITPVGSGKIGDYEYTVNLNSAPSKVPELAICPSRASAARWCTCTTSPSAQRQCGADQCCARRRQSLGAAERLQERQRPRRSTSSAASRRCCRVIKPSLPDALDIKPIGDQSSSCAPRSRA